MIKYQLPLSDRVESYCSGSRVLFFETFHWKQLCFSQRRFQKYLIDSLLSNSLIFWDLAKRVFVLNTLIKKFTLILIELYTGNQFSKASHRNTFNGK